MSGPASFFDGRLRFEAGGFVYDGRKVAYGDVAGLEFKQQSFAERDGDTIGTVHETTLRLVLKSGRKLVIRPDHETGRKVRTKDKALHDSMARAAEWLGAYTFDARMDGYEAAFKTKGYVNWGRHQINGRGDVFYRHAYCLNLLDPQMRCMLYAFRLACLPRPKGWWKQVLAALLSTGEVIDLRRDRDCFLYFARRRLGFAWQSESLRAYRGVTADGGKAPPKEDANRGEGDAPKEEAQHEQRQQVPPPAPKAMPTHVQHLAKLGLAPDAAWDKVKVRYRELARMYHPDLMRGKGAREDAIKQAEETLKGINEAYGWLEDFYKLK